MLVYKDRPRVAATAIVLALAVTAPAGAQTMSAAAAWAGLNSLALGAGLSITSGSVANNGDAVTASGVRIFPTNDPNGLVVSMDSLTLQPRGELMALIPSPTIQVMAQTGGNQTRTFEITHNGEIMGMLTEQNAALDLNFPTLTAHMVPSAVPPATIKGTPQPSADPVRVDVTINALDASLRAAREGTAELTIDAASVSYDLVYPDPSATGGAMITQSGVQTAPHLAFSGTELDMLSGDDGMLRAAFDAGMAMSLNFTVQASQQTSNQSMGTTPLAMNTQGGASEFTITVADGRADITGSADAFALSGNFGPMQGAAQLAGMTMAFGAPLVMTSDDQLFRYMVSLDRLLPSPELLAMVGAGQFAGDAVTMTVDVTADGHLTREIGPDFGEGDTPPLDISRVRLDDLRLAVGDSQFTGNGAVTLLGGLLGQIGRDRPNANGDFTFDLVGGERLLNRLQTMGLVPADQLFFVRMMINGLGRSIGEDHLQSEVAIREGGTITVNGAPLPF